MKGREKEKEGRRLKAEAMATRARTLKDQLSRSQAEARHEDNKHKIQLWNEIIAEWPTANVSQALFVASPGDRTSSPSSSSSSNSSSSRSHFSRRVNGLCALGIPPKIRGAVWPLLIGNDMNVTRERFELYREEVDRLRLSLCSSQHSEQSLTAAAAAAINAAVLSSSPPPSLPNTPERTSALLAAGTQLSLSQRGSFGGNLDTWRVSADNAAQRTSQQGPALSTSDDAGSFTDGDLPTRAVAAAAAAAAMGTAGQGITSLLRSDLPRTFPTLKFFHDDGYMRTSLERVLYTYALCHPETGYVQGMSFVAAMLLLYMDEADAYTCLVNLLVRRGPRDFLSLDRPHVECYVQCFDHFFRECLPLLYEHLQAEAVASEMFLLDWYLSVFAKALPLEVAARVWDCYLAEGELFATKLSLGILRLYAPRLCNLKTEGIMTFLMHLPQDIDAEKLIQSVAQIHISPSNFERTKEACGAGRFSIPGTPKTPEQPAASGTANNKPPSPSPSLCSVS